MNSQRFDSAHSTPKQLQTRSELSEDASLWSDFNNAACFEEATHSASAHQATITSKHLCSPAPRCIFSEFTVSETTSIISMQAKSTTCQPNHENTLFCPDNSAFTVADEPPYKITSAKLTCSVVPTKMQQQVPDIGQRTTELNDRVNCTPYSVPRKICNCDHAFQATKPINAPSAVNTGLLVTV